MKGFICYLLLPVTAVAACSSTGENALESVPNNTVTTASPDLDSSDAGVSHLLTFPPLPEAGVEEKEPDIDEDSGISDASLVVGDAHTDSGTGDAGLPIGDPNWKSRCIAFPGNDAGIAIPPGADCVAERTFDEHFTGHATVDISLVAQNNCPDDSTYKYQVLKAGSQTCCGRKVSGRSDVDLHATATVRFAHFPANVPAPVSTYDTLHSPIETTGYWTFISYWPDPAWSVVYKATNGATMRRGNHYDKGSTAGYDGHYFYFPEWVTAATGVTAVGWPRFLGSSTHDIRFNSRGGSLLEGDPWRTLSGQDTLQIEFTYPYYEIESGTQDCGLGFSEGYLKVDPPLAGAQMTPWPW